MKLLESRPFKGVITCKTNLHIGAGKENIGIGEIDNPIIKNPITNFPYIPGSSLKGKIRALIELKMSEKTQKYGLPCYCGKCAICILFGKGLNESNEDKKLKEEAKKEAKKIGVKFEEIKPQHTRLLFRDSFLKTEWKEKIEKVLPMKAEVKWEICSDRKTGTASGTGPRPVEFVPEGTQFDFEMVIRLFEEDEPRKKEYFKILADGFEMLENDYLGGCGTRGYGKVEITEDSTNKPMFEYFRDLANK